MGDRLNWFRVFKKKSFFLIDVEPLDFATTKLVNISMHLFTNSGGVNCLD
jgi:hypothetical protein